MNFIYRERCIDSVILFSFFKPVFIFPFIIVFPYYRSGIWRMFTTSSIRISLFGFYIVVMTLNFIFVSTSLTYSWNESFPNATFIPTHIKFMFSFYPIIKVSNYRNYFGAWCPNSKVSSFYTINCCDMRTKFFI